MSQAFLWQRAEISAIESQHRYRIVAQSMSGVWCYSAWSFPEKIIHVNKRTFFRELEYKLHYACGEQVPPAYDYKTKTAQLLLGAFRADRYNGVDAALSAAKACCVEDWLNNNNGDVNYD